MIEAKLSSLSIATQEGILLELIRDQYKNNLFALCSAGLGYQDINRHTHGDMIEALEAKTTRKLIIMPRGTLKSSIGVVGYAIQSLLKNPNERILIDSQLYTNSKNFLREIRYHLEGEKLKRLFGTFETKENWTEGEITIKQRTRILKESSITCGGVGTVKVGQHYDKIIIDDYNSDKNSSTKEGCEKIINHYRMNTSILEPEGTLVVIATRYSDMDLPAHILKNEIGIDYVPYTN